MSVSAPSISWLEGNQAFPPLHQAWGVGTPAPGLLAAGGDLRLDRLCSAYSQGIFPWFSQGQPPLWWSPDPRMVLRLDEFRMHASFRKVWRRFVRSPDCEIRMDSDFAAVIAACAQATREGQNGTWISPEVMLAYRRLHQAGWAHSVETWCKGRLIGGLYVVALGRGVFGESMFSHVSDASKLALSALVAFCRQHGVTQIDCQQKTPHLASLGAREIPRAQFVAQLSRDIHLPAPVWRFDAQYWQHL